MPKHTSSLDIPTFPRINFESILGGLSAVNEQLASIKTISLPIPNISTDFCNFVSDNFNSIAFLEISSDIFGNSMLYTFPETKSDKSKNPLLSQRIATDVENKSVAKDSTESSAINNQNDEYLNFLRSRSESFAIAIKRADFEDGMMNDVTYEVESYLSTNKFATCLWLNSLYSKNQKDYELVSGLLRIIGLTIERSNSDLLLPIVKCGLADNHSETQEAALMVIERWRTKECLDALKTTNFTSKMISKYAKAIAKELEEELTNAS